MNKCFVYFLIFKHALGNVTVYTTKFSIRSTAGTSPDDEAFMMRCLAQNAQHILLAARPTDFHKQISGLTAMVSMQFKLDPFQETCVFIFVSNVNEIIQKSLSKKIIGM